MFISLRCKIVLIFTQLSKMIQRIQSIFLLLAAACAFGLFALPFANTTELVSNSDIFKDGLYTIQDNIALLALFCLAGGLAFISIFLFKNRKSQLLMGRFAIIANVIGLVLAIALFFRDLNSLDSADNSNDVELSDGWGLYLPIAFLIFALLAQRFINKDDKLVKSMDRLR